MRKLLLGRVWRALGWKPSVEAEIAEEVQHHLDLLAAEGRARGLSPDQSEAEARRRFGGEAAIRAECERLAAARDRRAGLREALASWRDEIRLSCRALARSPAYTLGSGVTLALVVAANALVFSVVYAVLLRPLPYPESDRLVALNERTATGDLWELSLPNLDDWRTQSASFTALAAWWRNEVTLVGEDTPRIQVAAVSAEFFEVLRTPARLGRSLEPGDQTGANGPVAVLSHGAWLSQFGGDLGVVGTTIRMNSDQFTIVGVMPPSFRFPDPEVAAWVAMGSPQPWMRNRAVHVFRVFGRLRDGVSLAAAAEELTTISARVDAAHQGEDTGHRAVVWTLAESITGDARTPLLVLLGSVGAMLLLACANLAGLALTRASAREGELALRAALGATRVRLGRQLVTESLVLALIAGGVGLALAAAGFEAIVAALPGDLPRPSALRLDGTVVLATFGIAVAAGLGIGAVAAIRASKPDLRDRLSAGAGRSVGHPRGQRIQRALVAVQVALSLVLVSGGGLLLRSLRAVTEVDPGFRPDGLAVATVSLPSDRYDGPAVLAWYEDLPNRLTALPGVASASAASSLPVSGGGGTGDITAEGVAFPPGETPGASFLRVLPGYFRTTGIPLIRGREFTDRDRGSPMVVIINAAMARRLWGDGDPLGKRIKIGPQENEPWLTVVGVVGDVHTIRLDLPPRYDTYEPFAQRPRRTMEVVVRTAGDPSGLVAPLRQALRQADPQLPVWNTGTMEDRIGASVAPRRFTAAVISGFGAAALLLAAVGVYGVTAYGVSRRKREFAVRIALGAGRHAVRGVVLRQALVISAAGVIVGLPAAVGLTRFLRTMLFGVTPADPVTYLAAGALLAVSVVAAAWLPARAATRADPAAALRADGG